ncbi:hypothetical protein F5B20DRAFT_382582 [Whalleya microplaca]|nr:hypothetical protein F5B20DRAFT_382582 [Whalleya microplaca]
MFTGIQLDPYRHTCEEYTFAATCGRIPRFADPWWRSLCQTLRDLLHKLVYHEAMTSSRQRPFMDAPASRNRVFLMWSYIGKTLARMLSFPIDLNQRGRMTQQLTIEWMNQCIGPSAHAARLILDERPGRLNEMVERRFPDSKEPPPAFGGEIEDLARKLLSTTRREGIEGNAL